MAITNYGQSADFDSTDFMSLAAFPADFSHFGGGGGGMVDLRPPVMIKSHVQQPSPPATSDSSPESSFPAPGESGHHTLAEDDEDEGSDDEDLSGHPKKRCSSTDGGASHKRGKASSAERRATHNAIERARRESLNGRFLELAGALPTMTNVKRPSKSVIVNKSLEFIYESQIREHTLMRENNALRAEVDEMRARLHMPPLAPTGKAQPAGPGAQQRPAQANYFGAMTAAYPGGHHPGQFPGFAMSGPTSAPLPRSVSSAPAGAGGMFAFGNPFNVNGFVGGVGMPSHTQLQTPQSPTTKSESGSEATTESTVPVVVVKDEATSTTNAPGVTTSQAEAMAALHAAHQYQQQQQFAAFAAAVSQGQAHPGAAAAVGGGGPWNIGGSFLF